MSIRNMISRNLVKETVSIAGNLVSLVKTTKKKKKKKHGKLKNKLNMLNINDNDKEGLFRILESRSSTSFDSLEDDFLSSTDSGYHSNSEPSHTSNNL